MRRNDIVRPKGGGYAFFGRVIRVLDAEHVFWLCCGLHFHISRISELEIEGYKGKTEWSTDGEIRYYARNKRGNMDFKKVKFRRDPRFIPMTTLRKLKQRATQYHKRNAWRTPLDYEFIQRRDFSGTA